jgi:hypothetical protein
MRSSVPGAWYLDVVAEAAGQELLVPLGEAGEAPLVAQEGLAGQQHSAHRLPLPPVQGSRRGEGRPATTGRGGQLRDTQQTGAGARGKDETPCECMPQMQHKHPVRRSISAAYCSEM